MQKARLASVRYPCSATSLPAASSPAHQAHLKDGFTLPLPSDLVLPGVLLAADLALCPTMEV